MTSVFSFVFRSVTLILLGYSILFVSSGNAFANEGAGIGIKPATIEEAMDPGESKSYTVTVSNLSDTTETYYIFARDIRNIGYTCQCH